MRVFIRLLACAEPNRQDSASSLPAWGVERLWSNPMSTEKSQLGGTVDIHYWIISVRDFQEMCDENIHNWVDHGLEWRILSPCLGHFFSHLSRGERSWSTLTSEAMHNSIWKISWKIPLSLFTVRSSLCGIRRSSYLSNDQPIFFSKVTQRKNSALVGHSRRPLTCGWAFWSFP